MDKQKNGNTIRLEDNHWSHSIYVASDNKSDLKSITDIINVDHYNNIPSLIKAYDFIHKYERITDSIKLQVLKLSLLNSIKASTLARMIENIHDDRFGKFRLYNVDLLPEQSYFYEHDIFPLAFCEIHQSCGNSVDDYNNSTIHSMLILKRRIIIDLFLLN